MFVIRFFKISSINGSVFLKGCINKKFLNLFNEEINKYLYLKKAYLIWICFESYELEKVARNEHKLRIVREIRIFSKHHLYIKKREKKKKRKKLKKENRKKT